MKDVERVFGVLQSQLLLFSTLLEHGSLEHLQPRSPKEFGARRIKKRSQPRAPKALSVRRGPTRCPVARARPRYTGDPPGTPDTTICYTKRRGLDASATHKRTLNRRLPSDGAVAGKGNRRSGNRVDGRTNHRN
jgi:hypothetical protein